MLHVPLDLRHHLEAFSTVQFSQCWSRKDCCSTKALHSEGVLTPLAVQLQAAAEKRTEQPAPATRPVQHPAGRGGTLRALHRLREQVMLELTVQLRRLANAVGKYQGFANTVFLFKKIQRVC